MKFSVVIPLYNKEHYIGKTLKSVLNQTFQDFEIIVVNDGSTDHSLDAARSIKSDRVQIISQENAGVAVARNTGIEHASAEYIAFLDADDEWYPEYLQTINALTENFPNSDMFVTAYRIVMGNEKYHYSAHLSDEPICLESYWSTFQNAYDIVWTSATVIKKQAIVKAGMFTPGEKIGQDLDLWARVARNNPKVAYSPEVCVDYNRGAEQNARTRVKIAYPKAFMSILEQEMQNDNWSTEEKNWMENKYNKKMTVYVFTSILANKRKQAREILRKWNEKHPYKLIPFLYVSSFCPNCLNRWVYSVRLKVF